MAEFNGAKKFDLFPAIGTDLGICTTIRPLVDFHPTLTPPEKDLFLIPKGENVTSGDSNGLTLHLDTESYDHGFVASEGSGVSLVVHHHGDQPLLGSGTVKLMVRVDAP